MPDQTLPAGPAVFIFDLDGTILSINSFPLWARFMLVAPFAHLGLAGRLHLRCGTALALLRRKLRLSDHERLKWQLQRLWQGATFGDNGATQIALQHRLLRHVRPDIQDHLDDVATAMVDAVLATAAASDYAEGLGSALGFRHVLSTPSCRAAPGPSNVGTNKRDAVMRFLIDKGWQTRRRILFTDHCDDLPLITICDQTYWYGSKQGRAEAHRAAPTARISIPPTRLLNTLAINTGHPNQ